MKDHEEFLSQWQSFKLHLIELRKKLLNFKDHISTNKLKLKNTATEWVLRQVLGQFQDDFGHIVAIAKIALVAPVSNAWPERGASAIMRIKTRSRSQMKNDLLEALTMILMNGPDPNTTLADELIKKSLFDLIQAAETNVQLQLTFFLLNHPLLCLFKQMISLHLWMIRMYKNLYISTKKFQVSNNTYIVPLKMLNLG